MTCCTVCHHRKERQAASISSSLLNGGCLTLKWHRLQFCSLKAINTSIKGASILIYWVFYSVWMSRVNHCMLVLWVMTDSLSFALSHVLDLRYDIQRTSLSLRGNLPCYTCSLLRKKRTTPTNSKNWKKVYHRWRWQVVHWNLVTYSCFSEFKTAVICEMFCS